MGHETLRLLRDCEATAVPEGRKVLIPEGAEVTLTQTLGGSFSVITDRGFMARIENGDADALGKEPLESAVAVSGPPTDRAGVEAAVWEVLRTVYDPEIPVNVVDLGLVYVCRVTGEDPGPYRVEIEMTMTAPGCGMGEVIREDAFSKVHSLPGVGEAEIEFVWEPLWNQSMMSEAARLQLGMDF